MKKRLVSVFLLSVFALLMIGCTPLDVEDYDTELDNEYNRIVALLPSEFNDDLLLPAPSNDYTIQYILDGATLLNGILPYEPIEVDTVLEIVVIITYREIQKEYTVSLTQTVEEPIVEEEELVATFESIFSYIDTHLPDVMTSNVTLPTIALEGVQVSFTSTCTSIVRHRLVYTFPEQTETCRVDAHVINNGDIRSQQYNIEMSAVEDLPRLPQIHINTENNAPITSKEDYINATISLSGDQLLSLQELDTVPILIRGRGNSTFYMPKQSFKIKFEEQTKFLSDYAERDWVLLANFTDHTLIRNALAFQMASGLQMAFSPTYVFVDVYMNGEYLGNYMLTDQIEVTKDRVDIEENVATIDTGYLLEFDRGMFRDGEPNDNYFFVSDIPFVLHSPDQDDDHYMEQQKTFIQNYMQLVFDTLEQGEEYTSLIDEASFIDWFIVNEVFKNVDSGYSSVYYYKDAGGVLYMGPVWDFDLSTGNPGHLIAEERGPEGWYTPLFYKNVLFYYLMQYEDFQEHLQQRWNEVYDTVIITLLDEVFEQADAITYSRYQNFERWDIIGINYDWYTATEVYELKTYDEQVWFLHDYLRDRIAWLDNEINGF